MLQEKLDPDKIGPLAQGLSYDENAKKAYEDYLSLAKKLTNPYPSEYGDLTQALDMRREKQYSFFPPSRAVETELVKKLYGGSPIPGGFNLLDALVKKIQKREIDLTPKEESGWYDYQIYAFEPLVNPGLMPEAKRLYLGDRYKKELIELFKASIALTRESHIKQLEIPRAGAAPPAAALPAGRAAAAWGRRGRSGVALCPGPPRCSGPAGKPARGVRPISLNGAETYLLPCCCSRGRPAVAGAASTTPAETKQKA